MINVSSLSLNDVKTILNLYLFGQATAPEFLSDRIRPDGTAAATEFGSLISVKIVLMEQMKFQM